MEDNLSVLLEEYKEMRNEIRASYSLYFSILFGALFAGIVAAFLEATTKQWIYITIPFIICSWVGIVTFIRCNIQHISSYLVEIENKINIINNNKNLYYETEHAPSLWFSKLFLFLGLITSIPLIIVYGFSIFKGYQWLSINENQIFSCANYLFLILSLGFAFIIIYLFIEIPKRTRFTKINKKI